MKSTVFIMILLLFTACVKDEGAVSNGANTGTTGGTTTGSPATGSDPLASEAWHLKNTGQTSYADSGGIAGEDINIDEVHEMDILGRGVRIAVSDSGVQIDHPDLSSNTLSGEHRNYTYANSMQWNNADPSPSDAEGHGTAVSGLIAALGWNNLGSRGVAPAAKFAAFRFVFNYPATETQASLLSKAIDQTYGNFDIFNYSYGYNQNVFTLMDSDIEDALRVGVTTLRESKGALYVQSAGNSFEETPVTGALLVSGNTNANSDLSTPYKIVVGAVNADAEKSSYSTPGSSMWVSAPGGEYGIAEPAMITTDIQGCNAGLSYYSMINSSRFNFAGDSRNQTCDYTSVMNGSSSATPVTSGVIALMLEARPELKWRDVKHILATTADQIDYNAFANTLTHPQGYDLSGYVYDYKWITNAAGIMFSNWYGFGRIDAKAAVDMAKTFNLSTLGTFEQTKNSSGSWYYNSGTLTGLTITDQSSAPLEHKIWVGHNYIIENIQIEITSSHPYAGDLGIILESPSGTESQILNVNNKIYGTLSEYIMGSNAFYGEESVGWWTIKIVDGDNTYGTGNLTNWKILVSGHRKTSELNNPYPVTGVTLSTVPMTSDRTPVFAFSDSISLGSLIRYEASVERDSDGSVMKNWTSLGLINSGNLLTGMTLTPGIVYNLKVRAVSSAGNSSIQLVQWTAN
jgi:subtilisin family serine protease